MKYAPIVPMPMLADIKDYDYHMVLAPMCRFEAYGTFYYHVAEGFKILDNGAAEGNTMDIEELCGWGRALHADEVIVPDVMHNTEATASKLVSYVPYMQAAGLNCMAVLQATSWTEFDTILDIALQMEVSSVALPKLLTKYFGGIGRIAAAEIIRQKSDIPIHCLGSSTHPNEVKELARQGIVRGIDSAAPVVLGLQGLSVKHARYDWETSHRAVEDYWNAKPTEEVYQNLDIYRRWCQDPPPSFG